MYRWPRRVHNQQMKLLIWKRLGLPRESWLTDLSCVLPSLVEPPQTIQVPSSPITKCSPPLGFLFKWTTYLTGPFSSTTTSDPQNLAFLQHGVILHFRSLLSSPWLVQCALLSSRCLTPASGTTCCLQIALEYCM